MGRYAEARCARWRVKPSPRCDVIVEADLGRESGTGSLMSCCETTVWFGQRETWGQWVTEKRLVVATFACWPRGPYGELIRTSDISDTASKLQATRSVFSVLVFDLAPVLALALTLCP